MSSFVVFGNLERKFERMAIAIKENYDSFPKPLFIQAGINFNFFENAPSDIIVFRSCSYSDFSEYILNSELVVTHGGVGTIKESMFAGLKPAVFVRYGSKNEHIDNHQVDWCNLLFEADLALKVDCPKDLNDYLIKKEFKQKKIDAVKSFFDDKKLKQSLHGYIKITLKNRLIEN